MDALKTWAVFSFLGLWLALLFLLPGDPSEPTQLGADIGRAIGAVGGALVLWCPVFGTLYAVRSFRRKKN